MSKLDLQTAQLLKLMSPSRSLDSQDIINLDLTIYLNGFHGDTSAMFIMPDVDRLGQNLVDGTKEALELGIKACGPGQRLNGIGKIIQYVPYHLLVVPRRD